MKFKRLLSLLLIILIIIVIVPLSLVIFTSTTYDLIFNQRFETEAPFNYKIEEFEGLQRSNYEFESNNNDLLKGYLYYNSKNNIKIGTIIIAHGLGGGGHTSYMECIYYFVKNDFLVFTYDGTGNDESNGKNILGLPQQLIDLEYAINFYKNNFDYGLPIFLFGHSWGGYAVSNVLNYVDNISGIVSVSGFNSSTDMIKCFGDKYVGIISSITIPFVKKHEYSLFGEYSNSSAIQAFNKTTADILIIHSEDDEVVPIECGYNLYYQYFKDNERFSFIKYNDKGHSTIYYSYDGIEYFNKINEQITEFKNKLSYDYKKKKNHKRYNKDLNYFCDLNIDRKKVCNMIDRELFDDIIDFYKDSIL